MKLATMAKVFGKLIWEVTDVEDQVTNWYKTLCNSCNLSTYHFESSTQDSAKLLEQIKSGFKRTIN